MGYTHYYSQKRDLTDKEWGELTAVTKVILSNLPEHSLSAGGFYKDVPLVIKGWDGTGDPEVGKDAISLNGDSDADMDHETFLLTRERSDDGFSFCKTNRKPYDLAVTAILLVLQEIAPDACEIGSDGDMRGNDWEAARTLLKTLP